MMRSLPMLLAVAALTAASAMAQDAPAPQPTVQSGKAVAQQVCRSCHLISPEDRGPVPDGVPSFTALANKPGQTEASLTAALLKQHPIMPTPPITQQQAREVVAYILSLRQ